MADYSKFGVLIALAALALLLGLLALLPLPHLKARFSWAKSRLGRQRQPAETDAPVPASLLHGLVVGQDNRTSTSKCVVLAWTLAIAYMIAALLIAKLRGDSTGWDVFNTKGLQDAYLLFLGGPFAAALLAKFAAMPGAQSPGKPAAAPGSASPSQLVMNDQGTADLGDFQYVLFNGLTLAYVLGTFVGNLHSGLPDVPKLLVGLALTSAGGYAGKQLISSSQAPVLNSLSPTSVTQSDTFDLWGTGLVVANGSSTGDTPPTVEVGGVVADTPTILKDAGLADHLKVKLGPNTPSGEVQVKVTRSDGVVAATAGGVPSLSLRVVAARVSDRRPAPSSTAPLTRTAMPRTRFG